MSQECREMSQECRDVVACRARSLNFTVKRQQSRRLRSTLRHYNRIPPDWGVTCRVLSRISCIQLHGPVPAGAVLLGYGKKSLQKGRCGASCTERTAHIQLSAVRTYSCTSAQPPCCRVVRSDATCSQPVALTPHYHGLSGYRRGSSTRSRARYRAPCYRAIGGRRRRSALRLVAKRSAASSPAPLALRWPRHSQWCARGRVTCARDALPPHT